MSESIAGLRRKIESAGDLQSVVRTMKAIAAANIGQFEKSAAALSEYYRVIELGLSACFRKSELAAQAFDANQSGPETVGAIVFGSDQGLVGQFNEVIAEHAIKTLATLPGKPEVWAVGERVHARLADAGLPLMGLFAVPNSVTAITPLVGRIQIECETCRAKGGYRRLYVFHNRPIESALYEPVGQRLLPLDSEWQRGLAGMPWPTANLPEVMPARAGTLRALIREYLFITLFRACAESLTSENASRLAAMQRAEKNIGDMLENLRGAFNRLRQSSIDEELFDVIAGCESLAPVESRTRLP